MENRPSMYTATMAKVLEDQGNYSEALSIYRRLLTRTPNNPELVNAIERVNGRLGISLENQVVQLFEKWLELVCTQARLNRLHHLDRHFGHQKR